MLILEGHAIVLAHVCREARAVGTRVHCVVGAGVGVVKMLVARLLLGTHMSDLLREVRDFGMLTELAGVVDQVLVVLSEHVQKLYYCLSAANQLNMIVSTRIMAAGNLNL